ncbi:rhodanese-like domain-containing protein [Hymenobacter sp. BRD67]|uniref:rhodanese-like domain-containing protein n=1 Tax=Hymenobacter sp. BRD67 TaxID=2675877 RepID=UPI003977AE6E
MLPDLTPADLHARLAAGEDIQLIDVREQREFDYCRIQGSALIPLGEIPRRAAEIRPRGRWCSSATMACARPRRWATCSTAWAAKICLT